jgi:type VI secretion system protein ImpL
MKQMLTTIFKGLLVLTVLALVALVVVGLVMAFGGSWWIGCFLLVGLVGMGLGALVLRKHLQRRREQRFVHQIIAQDESMQQQKTAADQNAAKQLQARWKEAIDALRRSHLRKFGNPLYALPWYMMIGESGSGKTTAIQSARLSSPFAEVSRTSGISGTRNCDWWFFEQAILIDTAGRYAIPVDEGRDKDEWQQFLSLLAKFRKKEPLNGLVITVAADRLIQGNTESLLEDGRTIRRRMDELMRVLGARFPAYVMVTKCDLVQGATQFCEALPEAAHQQAMGLLNQPVGNDVSAFTGRVFESVGHRLRGMRLLLLNQIKHRDTAADMLLFPEEFEKLEEPLTAFITGAFQENPYQETPLLRGLFFSSGRQEGTPFSHFLQNLGLIRKRDVLPGTNKGLFLHDVFADILPRDRRLFVPTQHMLQWNRLTRHLGLTAWIAVMVAVCGLLSYAFVKNLSVLSDIRHKFEKPPLLQSDLLPDVITMDRYRQALIQVEVQNRDWWTPRLGLNTSLKVERALKTKFVSLFDSGFLKALDKKMENRMTTFDSRTPRAIYGTHVGYLVRRINLLKARLGHRDVAEMAGLPQPVFGPVVLNRTDLIPEIQQKIALQNLYRTAWQSDEQRLQKELSDLQTWLKHLLSLPGVSLNWLTDWVSAEPDLPPVTLDQFWGQSVPNPAAVSVQAAFTQAGSDRVHAALGEIEAALFDPLVIAESKAEFETWYPKAYLEAWREFIRGFDSGMHGLTERDPWLANVRRIPTAQGPYNALINRIAEEFDTFRQGHPVPAWVALTTTWQRIVRASQASDVVDPQQAGILKKATREVTSSLKSAGKALGVQATTALQPETQLMAARAYRGYQQALEAAIKAADSRSVAFKLAADMYSQDSSTGQAPLLVAHRDLQQIRNAVGQPLDDGDAPFWELIGGNIRFLQQYLLQETACALQSKWEKEVLLEARGIGRDQNMGQLMMGANGLATSFINGPARPFISRSYTTGFSPKRVFDRAVPFETDFMTFLTKGALAAVPRQSSYRVKIRTYPTDTNRDAKIRPHATLLELQCGDRITRLENLNYPVTKTFVWSPADCGDVVFQIFVSNLVLTKTYTGYTAFAQFLEDFKTGQRSFDPSAFPDEEAALRRMGISYIRAKYQFQGQRPVLQVLYDAPGRPPRRIATCWDP